MEERLSGCAWRLTQARTLLTMSWLSRDIPYNRLSGRVCYLAAPDAGRDRGQVERAQEIASTLTADLADTDKRARPYAGVLSEFLSHSLPSGTVHRQSRGPRSPR